ncbi:peptidoglycan/xylan/chitin deacetylase (PgdA/CDA1 family) [Flavobacterium sp. CG_23.5]|uniref:polysaccharide deacetylase family protein n=1 Tax=unclassified Flavobacterium TaxID=196869 RepID=UPI0018C92181|nr:MULTISPECIES: polysaccharide deacetylase family protein [unclassified Flavobacterium]MBG6111110.1 peptidoglycan/xylan/chitin deacetylase (PgdA/CDA1 family) [Flavobacterium sp. CG_9.10]MBP2282557.1 peptidoglycan/xylan/chitin deacetylase (PgdA/CDA1 family) [Flavobacterium sp. CG_23.5]
MIYVISILVLIGLAFLAFLNFQFKLLSPASKKLRILEYHSVSVNGFEDQITISKEKIKEQFEYLKNNNYKTLSLSEVEELKNKKQPLPPKSVVLTFDDGFLDNHTELYPLLQQYNFKAVCFIVLGRIGQKADWNGEFVSDNMIMMNKQQLFEVSSHIELGYHTFKHDNYAGLSLDEIEKDLQLCQEVIKKEALNVYPALAYTYGGYYRKKGVKQDEFFKLLEKYGIKYGLRIGNRINVFPFKNNYLIQRIDIRGRDTMEDFKKKVVFGRKKVF